jgi:hypothetical protein
MDLNTWPVIAGGLAVALLVLILAVLAVTYLVSGGGPKARAKQENTRAKRQDASDERDEDRAKRQKTRAEREEEARKARY